MATAAFSQGFLKIVDDGGNGAISVGRNAAGTIRINGGAVPIAGAVATVANTTRIKIFGAGGNDTLTIDETNGAMPPVEMLGDIGNDTLTGGSAADTLYGQTGTDTLDGKGGADLLYGGPGSDILTGGDGSDQMFGGSGNDRLIWNPGDDSDLMEGDTGFDAVEVNGGAGAETFNIAANGARVRFDRVTPAPFTLDIGTSEKVTVTANGGDDVITAGNGLAPLVKLIIDGGDGNDTITGGDGADTLIGGNGNDGVRGGVGADKALLGAGDDKFTWNPGDGSDVVEGQSGVDTLTFNGSSANELIALSANGARTRLNRNIANITMDLDNVETIGIAALGGADAVTIGDLGATDVKTVNVELGLADGQLDSVTVGATDAPSVIDVVGAGSSLSVTGLAARVNITQSETGDRLTINALGGGDTINAGAVAAGVTILTIDGGAGDDTINGSQGDDLLLGGIGTDTVLGDNGNDTALLGAGDDTFIWDPGDGSDVVEGQEDVDTLRFNGANASELINISANGGRALFIRDIANIVMDLNDLEKIDFRALGGADNVFIGDMSGTDVIAVAIDLAGSPGVGDGAADTVTVNATQGADAFGAFGSSGAVSVFGLQARVDLSNVEAANDRLVLNGQGGDDVVDTSGLSGVGVTFNGGLGADLFLGGDGDDTVLGGDGNDTALMGAGDDTFIWNPGDDSDTIEGQGNFDTLLFNGANIGETINISANGGRATFTRDIANVVMDLNDVEKIDFRALGGADTITVGDLSGTDVTDISIDLSGSAGGGDGAADTIIINATEGDDVIVLFGDATGVSIIGLAAQINLVGFEAANDRVIINGLGGDDVIDASGLGLGALLLTADGGAGADILIGGDGGDTLLGGLGDDVLIGNGGLDILDGGAGDNVVIQ